MILTGNRIIKESICESWGLSECSFFAQDLYKRLITYADDYGRFKDPSNPCNWIALLECILSIVAIVLGAGAALCIPELAPLGVIVAFIGLGGVIFGHW